MEYYIPISRRLFEHQLWREKRIFSKFEAWLDILQSARFEDSKILTGNRFIEVRRGQMPASLRYLSERWQWSTKKVNSFLELLLQDGMICKEKTRETGQTIITICKYERYNTIGSNQGTDGKQNGTGNDAPRKQQRNKYNKDNKEEKREESKEIPPLPPRGESVSHKARILFENHFRDTFGEDYYWTAKDAGNMVQLLRKLKFQREQKQMDTTDNSVLYALQYLLASVREGWVFDNFSVTNLNSKFNEIIARARNGKSADTPPKFQTYSGQRTTRDKAASRESLEELADAILGQHSPEMLP